LRQGLSRLVFGRVRQLFEQLSGLVGEEKAAEMVQQLSLKTEEVQHGITR
jgi:hypothetical protein